MNTLIPATILTQPDKYISSATGVQRETFVPVQRAPTFETSNPQSAVTMALSPSFDQRGDHRKETEAKSRGETICYRNMPTDGRLATLHEKSFSC
ncbi:hypothetical protein JTE90_014558 [Oedothorax gibbosus]|uniref:Uncharacterized protein n=1 Tax=Oedothorax gibbosus TaxID=931172 RepID=A0AAV6UEG5_9ARAC|nr:hypothetical protein JTE90_014558 [Oedothorax gibbosus]